MTEKTFLLQRLDEARKQIKGLLAKINPSKEIYPGWTIRKMLAHITGWDDATIDSLRAHVAGREPAITAARGINDYNAQTVTSREALDYEHVLQEWEMTRNILKTILREMPDEKFLEPLVLPWGEKGTVTYLIEIFTSHEEEHARDIHKWLENPDKPLVSP